MTRNGSRTPLLVDSAGIRPNDRKTKLTRLWCRLANRPRPTEEILSFLMTIPLDEGALSLVT